MDKTTKNLLFKFIMTFIFAYIALAIIQGNVWSWVLLVALATTALNYVVGDVLILPGFSNTVASVADGLMAMLTAYVAGVIILGFETNLLTLLIFGTLVTIGEYILHRRLLKKSN